MENVIILGAGIAGLSASNYLKDSGIESTVYEKNATWGGLCNSFVIDGFLFDTFVHLAFSKDDNVNKIFEQDMKLIYHVNSPSNYHKGIYIKHPVQNNLFKLDLDEKIRIIEDFIERDKDLKIENYENWLYSQYGKYFSDIFPKKYTRKYWTIEASEMETNWVSIRMYKPTIKEILTGALSDDTPNYTYAPKLRYPEQGGFKAFLNGMALRSNIQCNKEVIEIDVKNKIIKFKDDSIRNYNKLISSIPLTEICDYIKDIPAFVKVACSKLDYTSGVLISLGFRKPDIAQNLMFYIYDEDIFPSRIYSPSLKSINNVPMGCSSLQAEIYFSKMKPLHYSLDELLEVTINQMIKMNLFNREDIIVKDIRIIKYANVIFSHGIYENREIVRKYLIENEIIPVGRFGEWDYLWSDQSFNSGKKGAEQVILFDFEKTLVKK